MAILEMRGVSKGYGGAQPVLQGIDLDVEEGELLAVIGYSGSGKTTLLSLIAGLLHPDAGTVAVGGRQVTRPDKDIGVMFQNYSLLPWLSAFGNVMLAVEETFRQSSRREQRERAEEVLDLVGLLKARDKRPHELSGGMRQRVALARALSMDPKVLLLDEPLGALDALTRATLQDELQSICLKAQKTVLLITNDVDEALLLADRVVPLSAGPAARLGPAVVLGLPRPRDRNGLSRDPRFKRARNELIDYLLGPGGRRTPAAGPHARRAPALEVVA